MELGLLGHTIILLSLISSAVATVLYGLALNSKNLLKMANIGFSVTFVFITAASIVLLYALVTSDFSIVYVSNYTDSSLPLFYKISAFWGGQSGSLLLWALLLVIFGAIEIVRLKNIDEKYVSAVMLTVSITTTFFIVLISFIQDPFQTYPVTIPADGNGLNPLLQNPGMVIHPPTLYIGYVGYTIVIAHATASILTKDVSIKWVTLVRKWSLVIFAFLTIGIIIGGWWAYVELGWGGYWAWDPVENASLMPWFSAVAFIHSAYMYEKQNTLKIWAYILALITFELTILGTFITRSGLIESVHSFGPNEIGTYFLVFIGVSSAIFLAMLFKYTDFKKILEETEFNIFSRNGLIFLGNIIFIAITIAVMFGTLSPAITEWIGAEKQAIDQGWYNFVTRPFFFAMILLSGAGLLTAFRVNNIKQFWDRFIIPASIALIGVAVMIFLKYSNVWSLILNFAVFFAAAAILVRFFELLKHGVHALVKAPRIVAALITHTGLVIIAFGVVMSSFYNYNHTFLISGEDVEKGTIFKLPPNGYTNELGQFIPDEYPEHKPEQYSFRFGRYQTDKKDNYMVVYAPIEVFKNDKPYSQAFPEIRQYNKREGESFKEVAYISTIIGDLYFILYSFNEDGNSMRIAFTYQPFVGWLWAGCIVMVIGALMSAAVNIMRKKQDNSNAKSFIEK